MNQEFPKSARLRTSLEFQRVYRQSQRWGNSVLLVFGRRNDLMITRLGLSVSRKFGGAVRRNRIKRLVREAFRLIRQQFPAGWDLIVIPRPGVQPTISQIQQTLADATRRFEQRNKTESRNSPPEASE